MEAIPISTTPQKEKEYILVSDNKNYKVKIIIVSDIFVEINEVERISGAYYKWIKKSVFKKKIIEKINKVFI